MASFRKGSAPKRSKAKFNRSIIQEPAKNPDYTGRNYAGIVGSAGRQGGVQQKGVAFDEAHHSLGGPM